MVPICIYQRVHMRLMVFIQGDNKKQVYSFLLGIRLYLEHAINLI